MYVLIFFNMCIYIYTYMCVCIYCLMLCDPHHISGEPGKSHWCNLFSRSFLETSNIPGIQLPQKAPIHYHALDLELKKVIQFQQALRRIIHKTLQLMVFSNWTFLNLCFFGLATGWWQEKPPWCYKKPHHLAPPKPPNVITLPQTNSLPLKMDGWNTTFLLGFGLFSGANR